MENKKIEWILRIVVFMEFLGHGIFALQGKEEWIGWIQQVIKVSPEMAATLLHWVGIMDVVVAIIVLIRPLPVIVLWACLWGLWTALLRPIVGKSIWDFVERAANWGAPLVLLLILDFPKNWKGWLGLKSGKE